MVGGETFVVFYYYLMRNETNRVPFSAKITKKKKNGKIIPVCEFSHLKANALIEICLVWYVCTNPTNKRFQVEQGNWLCKIGVPDTKKY